MRRGHKDVLLISFVALVAVVGIVAIMGVAERRMLSQTYGEITPSDDSAVLSGEAINKCNIYSELAQEWFNKATKESSQQALSEAKRYEVLARSACGDFELPQAPDFAPAPVTITPAIIPFDREKCDFAVKAAMEFYNKAKIESNPDLIAEYTASAKQFEAQANKFCNGFELP